MGTSISAGKDWSEREMGKITAQFYVGSTNTFDAWQNLPSQSDGVEHATGVWDGTEEHTAIVTRKFENVPAIIAWAKFLASLSKNDFILVTFDTAGFPLTNLAITNRHVYGARKENTYLNGVGYSTGIQHLGYTIPRMHGEPYTFVPNPGTGTTFIAFLVNEYGELSSI